MDDELAGADVLARGTQVVGAGGSHPRRATVASLGGRHLLRDDRVGAVGHRRAGRDPHGGPRPHRDAGAGAGLGLADQLQARGARRGVGGDDRVAVHRRGVERGHVVGRRRVVGERATERVVEADLLGAQHANVLEHRGAGFVDRDRHRTCLRAGLGGRECGELACGHRGDRTSGRRGRGGGRRPPARRRVRAARAATRPTRRAQAASSASSVALARPSAIAAPASAAPALTLAQRPAAYRRTPALSVAVCAATPCSSPTAIARVSVGRDLRVAVAAQQAAGRLGQLHRARACRTPTGGRCAGCPRPPCRAR